MNATRFPGSRPAGCPCASCKLARIQAEEHAKKVAAEAAEALAARQMDELNRRFDLHKPRPEDADKLDELRAIFKKTAALVVFHTPDNRERSIALTKLEEGLSAAVAAVVRPPAR